MTSQISNSPGAQLHQAEMLAERQMAYGRDLFDMWFRLACGITAQCLRIWCPEQPAGIGAKPAGDGQ